MSNQQTIYRWQWYLMAIVGLGFFGLGFIAACSDGKTKVTGSVTFDGKPVTSGTVTFVRTDGILAREGAVISQGSFQAVISPGAYQVELNGQKVVGTRKQKGFDGKDEVLETTEELFPERYNRKTELKVEIKPGPNVLLFEAKAK
jgi:hypothetical protein